MGLFGNDEEQDARLDALENHVRKLSESAHKNQLDVAEIHVKFIALQAKLDEKISMEDFDPSIVNLNDQLAKSRQELETLSGAAAESWSMLNAGAIDAFENLRANINDAADKVDK